MTADDPMIDNPASADPVIADSSAISTVTEFFRVQTDRGPAAAIDLLTEDVEFTNVSLPALRGRRAVSRALRALDRSPVRFAMTAVHMASSGDVVLVERVDEVTIGPVRVHFWVWGRFEVRDGRIAVWRDYFDYSNVAAGTIRGLVAVVVPRLRRTLATYIAEAGYLSA